MAFVRGQRRSRCTRYCRCDELTPEMQTELVTWDPHYWSIIIGKDRNRRDFYLSFQGNTPLELREERHARGAGVIQ